MSLQCLQQGMKMTSMNNAVISKSQPFKNREKNNSDTLTVVPILLQDKWDDSIPGMTTRKEDKSQDYNLLKAIDQCVNQKKFQENSNGSHVGHLPWKPSHKVEEAK